MGSWLPVLDLILDFAVSSKGRVEDVNIQCVNLERWSAATRLFARQVWLTGTSGPCASSWPFGFPRSDANMFGRADCNYTVCSVTIIPDRQNHEMEELRSGREAFDAMRLTRCA